MRIRQLSIDDYKGIDTAIQWAGAVVLFGRNDAGKSNILESITSGAGLGGSRKDPLRAGDQHAFLVALVELDRIDDEKSFDAELLAALLQVRHVPPLFPYIYAGEPLPDPEREQDRWGGDLYLSQFPASLLEWGHHRGDEETGSRQFKLGCLGPPTSEHMTNSVGSIAAAREALRERAFDYADDHLSEAEPSAGDVHTWFELLLYACLRSKWLLCDTSGDVLWLSPRPHDCSPEEHEAAHRLAAAFGDERVPILDGFVRGLIAGEPSAEPFLAIPETHEFRPWDIVRVAGSPERLETLATEVEQFVRSGLERVPAVGYPADMWLFTDETGTAISESVRELCGRLSEHATRIAPRFVTRGYEIRVDPLEQEQWHGYGDRRVRLALVRRDRDEGFDLAVAGSGLAVWAAFAIEEAMRVVDSELDRELSELLEGVGGPRDEEEDRGQPREGPTVGELRRLYILDEPERHLHPEAQDQAARWLASRMDDETSFLLATHALAFLSLPAGDVEYALVSRGGDGLTRAESITADVWGVLDARTSEAGVGSRAQLIQVIRAFLIVEGAHDELVLRHFYGELLASERVLILPIRGAKKARSLIEAELLAKLDKPLIVLFDDVRAEAVVARDKPSRKDIPVYSLWEMLQNWPPERKRPHVVEFVLPDIYAALPDRCVAQVVESRGGSFPGWRQVIKDFAGESGGRGFKDFLVARSGLPADTESTELLVEILERCRVQPRVELRRAMQEVFDRVRADSVPGTSVD